jgi:surface antigen
MLSKAATRATGLVTLLLASPAGFGFNLGFLHDAPASYFTERDWELVKGAVEDALRDAADGETVDWNNPDSGHLGTVTVLKTTQQQGMTCRTLKIYNEVESRSGDSYHRFCQQADGSWKAVPR